MKINKFELWLLTCVSPRLTHLKIYFIFFLNEYKALSFFIFFFHSLSRHAFAHVFYLFFFLFQLCLQSLERSKGFLTAIIMFIFFFKYNVATIDRQLIRLERSCLVKSTGDVFVYSQKIKKRSIRRGMQSSLESSAD